MWLQMFYLEDFHCLFELLLVFGGLLASGESHLQVADCRTLSLKKETDA